MTRTDIEALTIPDAPGVYFFKRNATVLYVGKATSLKSRIKSYFDGTLLEKRGPLVSSVVEEANRIAWQETDSVLEALLLEAALIKRLKPKGNSASKDDKSWNYVVVTNELFPRVLTIRGRELPTAIAPTLRKKVYGPFTQGGALKEALKIIRKIFPFFDTRFPLSGRYSPQAEKLLRFNQSIGVYPRENKAEYRTTIRHIMYLFEGKKKTLMGALERDMHRVAKANQFERAAELKRQLFALKHIQDIALLKSEYRMPSTNGFRIEAFDTAHLGGSASRAAMVVIEDGEPQKSEYRLFTIRTATPGDDYQALRELLERRFKHTEWREPQLLVLDGGRAHLRVATTVLAKLKKEIAVCAVVKDERHRPREIIGKRVLTQNHEASILLANSEAHRFSTSRHRRALRKERV